MSEAFHGLPQRAHVQRLPLASPEANPDQGAERRRIVAGKDFNAPLNQA